MRKDYVTNKITQLLKERNWSCYRLAKESGIRASTLKNMFSRGSTPSVPTLMHICEGFGITLSDFFNEDGTSFKELSAADQQLITRFHSLTRKDKNRIINYVHTLLDHDSKTKDTLQISECDTEQQII